MLRTFRTLIVVTGLSVTACAPHRVTVDDGRAAAAAAMAQADGLVLRGCHGCLAEARDIYARLAGGPLADEALSRGFAAAALLVIRERELSIDTGASIVALRAAADALSAPRASSTSAAPRPGPAAAGAAAGTLGPLGAARIVRLVEMLPPNPAGMGEAEFSGWLRDKLATATPLDDDVAWLATSGFPSPAREYLVLGVRCSELARPLLNFATRWRDAEPGPPDEPPVLVYRRALCAGAVGHSALERLVDADPRMAEAAYAWARDAPLETERASSTLARTFAADAFKAFPQSPATAYLMGTLRQVAGDYRDALKYFDVTLSLAPRHEHAQLGRTIALTYLRERDRAIAAATTLIEWNSVDRRDAYYWRANNLRAIERLTEARQDIDRSKQLGETLPNRMLAGVIEYEQGDYAPALTDLMRAWTLGSARHCPAVWYQGLVRVKQELWAQAASAFELSVSCYAKDISDDRLEIEGMKVRTDLDAAVRDAQLRVLTESLEDDQRHRWDSALNAASCLVRTGDRARARAFLDIAAEDPGLAADVATLRELANRGN